MKVAPDTNVLIGFFRDPESRANFDLSLNRPMLFLSSVVAMELATGCRTVRHRRALTSFLRPFESAQRIITPDHSTFLEVGRVLAALAADGIGKIHLQAIANDVLIAVSATRAGAIVVTNNAQDFRRIEVHTPIRWMHLPTQTA